MIKEFTADEWKDLNGTFAFLFTKDEPGKHIIQVFKKDQDGSYFPVDITVKDKGYSILLSVNRDPFDGYAVIR
ncbi:hypothetical protein [Chryseobacterium sp. ON_d1]|uniref:hypothetical protein n=1 Tax=Chryseobacterium sp. ON_d1 TaxID=2583211 RepID=UPI00115C1883|nr:hypothetical protein [Chryseobacterium sp. ON_d1]